MKQYHAGFSGIERQPQLVGTRFAGNDCVGSRGQGGANPSGFGSVDQRHRSQYGGRVFQESNKRCRFGWSCQVANDDDDLRSPIAHKMAKSIEAARDRDRAMLVVLGRQFREPASASRRGGIQRDLHSILHSPGKPPRPTDVRSYPIGRAASFNRVFVTAPPRMNRASTSLPMECERSTSWTPSVSATAFPSSSISVSPRSKPAFSAGLPGST